MKTLPIEPPADSVEIRFNESYRDTSFKSAFGQVEESSWLDKRPRSSATDSDLIGRVVSKAPTLRLIATSPSGRKEVAERVSAVIGTVIAIDGGSVTCEVSTPTGARNIGLLPDLFPEPPTFGMSFTLRMTEVDGILQPAIEQRVPLLSATPLDRHIDDLMEGFPSC